ncbi:uncharacterized protein LOC127845295 [Dreissena polymorpha]|uniref:uncharacterized protein LOC127845295 n=1 Tax=Dreissena polymorpha TaxID=45954 RepID=UPI002264B341|nr:uncharacterized protein LOC127845295 [Dreissena polymorpha]
MIPSAFSVAVVFLSCFYIVRCNVLSPCNAAVECANSTTVCENDFCHIQAGQVCTIETITTQASTTSAPTTTAATTTTATPTTTTTLAPPPNEAKLENRRKRSAGQQQCVSNASCVSGQKTNTTPVCACNYGYTEVNGRCNKDPDNGAGRLRVTEFCTVMVTTVLLFLI